MKIAFRALVDLIAVAAYSAIVYGCWQIYPPAAWIVGGSMALIAAVKTGRKLC